MSKFNVSSSLKNNYYVYIFIITSLLNSILLIHFTSGINNLRFIISDFVFILFICIISKVFKNKKLYFLIVSFLLSSLCCVNGLFYNNYMDYTSLNLLNIIHQLFGMPKGAVSNVFKLKDFIFYIQFIILFILYFKNDLINIKIKNYIVLIIALIILLGISLTNNDLYRIRNLNRIYTVNNFGIYNYHLLDFIDIINKNIFKNYKKEEKIKEIDNYFNSQKFKNNEYTDIFKNRNILFIHAESVQTMFLFNNINGKEITPNLNKLASEGLFFENYYSLEGVGTSSDSEFTINTSILPNIVKPAFINYHHNNYHTLIKEFKNKDYYTFSMHANACNYWNRSNMYPKLGYDHFYCGNEYLKDDIIGMGLSDKSFFKQSIEKLNKIKKEHQNFYGTLIALTNHAPFVSNLNFDSDYMENTRIGNYLKTLNYFDTALGEFINELKLNDLDDTVIVIYGDHDAKFRKEEYEYYLNKKIDFYEYEKLTRVPFIIWTKDIKPKKISNPMGSIDIAPTISNMFNLNKKNYLGNDMFNIEDNIVVFPNGNWLTNKIYYNNQLKNFKIYEEVSNDYINKNELIAKKRNEISNNILRYNYFN